MVLGSKKDCRDAHHHNRKGARDLRPAFAYERQIRRGDVTIVTSK